MTGHVAGPMTDLKLIAFDSEDLDIVSAHLQDAVLKIGEMTYLKREQRFAVLLNRFDWSQASVDGAKAGSGRKPFQRRRTALRLERVRGARTMGLDLSRKDGVLELLALRFEAAAPENPSGTITLFFAGGGAIQLDVECVEAELRDLGAAWATKSRPLHPITDE